MVSGVIGVSFLAAAMLAAGPVAAFTIVPADDETGRVFVVIERPYGDVVPFRLLPKPFDRVVQTLQGPETLSFRWRYPPSLDEGRGHIQVEADGRGTMRFHFTARQPRAGDTLAAAAVLIDGEGRALHSFLARATLTGAAAEAGPERHAVALRLERAPEWWERVDAIAFFNMTYHVERDLDEADIWTAMRRAVHRLTMGEGSEQRG